MKLPRPPGPLLVSAGGFAVLGAALDLFLFDRSPLAAGAFALYCVATSLLAWFATEQFDLAIVATATAASWGLVHTVAPLVLALAALPAALLVVPTRSRTPLAMATAALAALVAWLLTGLWTAASIAGVAGLLFGLAFPDAPTQGALRAMRSGALVAPGFALAAALVLNATTGRGDVLTVPQALRWSLALGALLVLVAVAVLGLLTLLESTAGVRSGAWFALSAALSATLGSFLSKDASVVLAAVASGSLVLPILAAIGAGRLRATFRSWIPLSLPIAAAGGQLGFLFV